MVIVLMALVGFRVKLGLEASSSQVPERVGTSPDGWIRFDPEDPGRLLAGAHASVDRGRSFRPLSDGNQKTVRLLGGARAVHPAFGPSGRMLFGEVLFDEPGVPFGHGAIAHAVEWDGAGWRILGILPYDPSSPEMAVRFVGYLEGRPVIATRAEAIMETGSSLDFPAPVETALVTRSGALYAATRAGEAFPLYYAEGWGETWKPVGGTGAVLALTEGASGIVYAVGSGLGRGSLGSWRWTAWPEGIQPTAIAAAPDGPRVATWGNGRLAVSLDGGETLSTPVSERISVVWAAFEPGLEGALWFVDSSKALYRILLE